MTKKKYEKYVFTNCIEKPNLPGHTNAKTTFSFRGARQISGANANFGFGLTSKPLLLEKAPHKHDTDEYLVFLGGDPIDWAGSFDAEIDFYLGEEQEHYLITKPTTIFIPKGLWHTPLNFRVINKPVLFAMILLAPRFTKTMMSGEEYSYDGPGYKGAPLTLDLDKTP